MGEQGQLDRFNLMSLTQDSLPPPPDFAQWSDLSYPQGTEEPSSDAHANLIYFLGACQALNVDLVPITWQPALADLGEGGQATIRQAHSLVDWSFAFRQFRPVDAEASDEARPQAYHALIREVSILKHPEIRENPCALTLEGVCWDVSREDEVWPVLIFEKSRHGNLREFLGSSTGRQANLEDIMSLWFDVATTIMYMHAANLVHCDIKPENVLVFYREQNGHWARVSDFGHSVEYLDPNEYAKVPNSPPWTAPERHHRGVDLDGAIRMEIYSLGMLFLWMLFREEWLQSFDFAVTTPSEPFTEAISQNSDEEKDSVSSHLSILMPSFVLQIIMRSTRFNTEEKNHWLSFFAELIAIDPAARNTNILELMQKLKPIERVPYTTEEMENAMRRRGAHMEFEVAKSFELIQADYSVRTHVTSGLKQLAQTSSCAVCRSNCAFQMSVCAKIGFGMRRNVRESELWLEKSGKTSVDDQIVMTRYKGRLYHNEMLNAQYGNGNLAIDYEHQYRQNGVLNERITQLSFEISDLQEELGTHWGVSYLKNVLASLLAEQGDLVSSERIYQDRLKELENDTASDPASMQIALNNLASIYQLQGKYVEAEKIYRSVLNEARQILQDKDHDNIITSLENLASVTRALGNYQGAETYLLEALQLREGLQGRDHPGTLAVSQNIASLWIAQGKYEAAETMMDKVMSRMIGALEKEHRSVIGCMGSMVTLLCLQGKLAQATERCQQLLNQCEISFGQEHGTTLSILTTQALLLQEQASYQDSARIFRRVRDSYERTLGPNHPDTLRAMTNFALALQYLAKFEEAEALNRLTMDRYTELELEHPDALTNINNLAGALLHQGKYVESESMFRKALAGRRRALGDEHPTTLEGIGQLGLALKGQGRYEQAEELFRESAEGLEKRLGPHHSQALRPLHFLADTMMLQGKYESAEHLCQNVLGRQESTLGTNHPETLRVNFQWGRSLQGLGRHKDAETVIQKVWEKESEVLGSEHPTTLATLAGLAVARIGLADYTMAEGSCRAALKGLQKVHGTDHPSSLICLDNLGAILVHQGKYAEADSMIRPVLPTFQKVLGPEHPDTLRCAWTVAVLDYWHRGQAAEAYSSTQRILETLEKRGERSNSLSSKCRQLRDHIASQSAHELNEQELSGQDTE